MTRYPVYVISKGRWERRQTVRTLLRMGVDFTLVVEPVEYSHYAEVVDPRMIRTLPFSNLGQGSIPARNWVWDDAQASGSKRHWILDDNIESVERFNKNVKAEVLCDAPFRAIEDFADRYDNLAICGMNYSVFCPAREARPPVRFNTRVYSCLLIDNAVPYRWRGRYNEDTDLCLRVLKDGYCTALFNAFLIGKRATMTQRGGNTDTIYNTGDQRLAFAQSLQEQHPDCVTVTRKFNRWHHHVDYRRFAGNVLRRNQTHVNTGPNEYGMSIRLKEVGV